MLCYKCTIFGSKYLFKNIIEEGTQEWQKESEEEKKQLQIEAKLFQFVEMREQYEEFQIWKSYSYTSTWQMKDMQNNMYCKK